MKLPSGLECYVICRCVITKFNYKFQAKLHQILLCICIRTNTTTNTSTRSAQVILLDTFVTLGSSLSNCSVSSYETGYWKKKKVVFQHASGG